MPVYEYRGYGSDGKSTKGVVDADSVKAAKAKIRRQGVVVTEVKEQRSAPKKDGSAASILDSFQNRISIQQTAMTMRQLASLVRANIPLVDALAAVQEQTDFLAVKKVMTQVKNAVNEGSSLAKAVALHPNMFDTMSINMINAGESSGTLNLVLGRLADLKEGQMRLSGKVRGALGYPLFLLTFCFALVIFLFVVIIPKLTSVFKSMNRPMPALTQVIMQISAFLVDWWWMILIMIGTAAFFFWGFIRSPAGRPKWDRFKLNAPLIGEVLRLTAATRFATTMATLLSAGVPILGCMEIAKNVVAITPVADAIKEAMGFVTEGQSIAEPLKRSGQFPSLMIHMISIGEKTGELPNMLQNIGNVYEEQVNQKIESMTSLLQPLVLVFMGLIVGVVVFAVFMPLLDMMNVKQR
jgi:general secretion pathway protein F